MFKYKNIKPTANSESSFPLKGNMKFFLGIVVFAVFASAVFADVNKNHGKVKELKESDNSAVSEESSAGFDTDIQTLLGGSVSGQDNEETDVQGQDFNIIEAIGQFFSNILKIIVDFAQNIPFFGDAVKWVSNEFQQVFGPSGNDVTPSSNEGNGGNDGGDESTESGSSSSDDDDDDNETHEEDTSEPELATPASEAGPSESPEANKPSESTEANKPVTAKGEAAVEINKPVEISASGEPATEAPKPAEEPATAAGVNEPATEAKGEPAPTEGGSVAVPVESAPVTGAPVPIEEGESTPATPAENSEKPPVEAQAKSRFVRSKSEKSKSHSQKSHNHKSQKSNNANKLKEGKAKARQWHSKHGAKFEKSRTGSKNLKNHSQKSAKSRPELPPGTEKILI